MDVFVIRGGKPLSGEVTPGGNKNAAFPLIAASLLTDEPVKLHNLPDIGDVRTMLAVMADFGVTVTQPDPHTATLHAASLVKARPDPELFGRIRGALVLMGPLVHRTKAFSLPRPGGDKIGRRRIDTHLLALQALGATVDYGREVEVSAETLHGADLLLDEASVTGTENAVMAAVLAKGETEIRNAASEPHVQQLCEMLNAMGANIRQIGSNTLKITGVDRLRGVDFRLEPDYLEIVSYIGAAVCTGGSIRIKNAAPHRHLAMPKLVFDRMGVVWEEDGDDIVVPAEQPGEVVPDLGGHIPKIDDGPWPAFPADMMSVAITMATQTRGTVLFHEKMFESRMFFVDKLVSLGARVVLCDPHRCIVQGPNALYGGRLESPDIRAGMALLLAALAAEGESTISNIGQIERGYERVDEKLRGLGADIERVGR